MAVAYRSASNTGGDLNVAVLAVPVPAGAAPGDVVLCRLARYGATQYAVTVPSGFVQCGTEVNADSSGRMRVYYKRLTVADTGTYEFSWGGAMWSSLHAVCFSGVKATGDPVGVYFTSAGGSYGGFPALSLTVPFTPGLMHTTYTVSATSSTPPTGFAEVVDVGHGSSAYVIRATTGTHTATGAVASPSGAACAVLLALEPAPAGGPVALDGAVSAASGAAAGLDVAGVVVVPLDAALAAAGAARAGLAVARVLGAAVPVAVHTAATLDVAASRALAGSVAAASAATGRLTTTAVVAGRAEVASWATAGLDTDVRGACAIAATATLALSGTHVGQGVVVGLAVAAQLELAVKTNRHDRATVGARRWGAVLEAQ